MNEVRGAGLHPSNLVGQGQTIGLGQGQTIGLGQGQTIGLGQGQTIGLGQGQTIGLGQGQTIGLGQGQTIGLGQCKWEQSSMCKVPLVSLHMSLSATCTFITTVIPSSTHPDCLPLPYPHVPSIPDPWPTHTDHPSLTPGPPTQTIHP